MTVCRFSNTGDDWYVLVGVAKDLILNPRSVAGGLVYTYKLINNGEKLEFVHKVCGDKSERGASALWEGHLTELSFLHPDPSRGSASRYCTLPGASPDRGGQIAEDL